MKELTAKIYTSDGKEVRAIDLPEAVFGVPWNADMMRQVSVSLQSNARLSTAKVKDRGEVSGGGKKPWRQKGTGRARHGSSRSPIWIGGGVTHGPTNEKDYTKKINRTTRQKALMMALSQKFRDGKVLFIDAVSAPDGKTKTIASALERLETIKGFETLTTKKPTNVLVLVPELSSETGQAFRNIAYAFAEPVMRTNPVSILKYRYVIIASPEASLDLLVKKATGVRVSNDATSSEVAVSPKKKPAKASAKKAKATA